MICAAHQGGISEAQCAAAGSTRFEVVCGDVAEWPLPDSALEVSHVPLPNSTLALPASHEEEEVAARLTKKKEEEVVEAAAAKMKAEEEAAARAREAEARGR